MGIESSSVTATYKQTAFRLDVLYTSTTIYYKVGTRLALRVHALHCFFTHTHTHTTYRHTYTYTICMYMYLAVVGSSEFTPRKQ